MIEMCFEAKNYSRLNETLVMLSKRRAQLKDAVGAMVRKAAEYVEATVDMTLKLELILTLRAVSEGKMHVEVERARLTKSYAAILEARGEVIEARKIMIETVVETLGGMDKREKTTFILEQVRLCLDTQEFIRANIMAKKIQVKVFKDAELEDLKLIYYSQVGVLLECARVIKGGPPLSSRTASSLLPPQIVAYHLHDHNWVEIFHAYQAMSDAPSLQADEAAKLRNLKLQVLYLVLAPFDMDQLQAMRTLSAEKMLSELPLYGEVLKLFITKEIFHFRDLERKLKEELASFGSEFDTAETKTMLATLHSRVTQHNIEVVSTYYARLTTERLASLLGLSIAPMEEQLCEMVTKKQVFARIDRPKGVVTFARPKAPNELLNDWSNDIGQLLNLLESTCHLVHKENMLHNIA